MTFRRTLLFSIILMAVGVLVAPAQREIPKDLKITLERYTRLGSSPSYSLTITADGIVKFTPFGKPAYHAEGTEPSARLTGNITTRQVRRLLAEFQKIKFFSLRNHYDDSDESRGGPSCPKYLTDGGSAIISIVENGKHKTVHHYGGCIGPKVLKTLGALEDKIDKTTNSDQWTSQFVWPY